MRTRVDAFDVTQLSAKYAGTTILRARLAVIATTTLSLLTRVGPSIAWSASTGAPLVSAPEDAAAIRDAIARLGPTAIKFGQAAANRPDLVGIPLADELRLLQDAVAPFATRSTLNSL